MLYDQQILELLDYMNAEDGYKMIKKYYLRFTYVVRTVTNCLLDPDCVETFNKDSPNYMPITADWLSFFQYFYDWEINKTLLKKDKNSKTSQLVQKISAKGNETLAVFFRTLQEESTLATFLIFNTEDKVTFEKQVVNKEEERENYRKIKMLIEILKFSDPTSYDIHLLTKALYLVRRYHC